MNSPKKLNKSNLIPILLIFLFLLSCCSTGPPFAKDPEEESGTTMENFTIYEYGSGEAALSWELSGSSGRETGGGLVVSGFELKLRRSKELVSLFTGQKLRLDEEEGARVGYMPGRIDLDLTEGMKGSAEEARYHFAEKKFSGKELSLTRTGKFGEINLSGKEFSYGLRTEKLTVKNGFKLTNHDSEGNRTSISGNSLIWPSGKRIEMAGDVKASLATGWKLQAERLTWDPDQGLLESSGSASADRDGTTVSGNSLRYESENEKLVVVDGRITEEKD